MLLTATVLSGCALFEPYEETQPQVVQVPPAEEGEKRISGATLFDAASGRFRSATVVTSLSKEDVIAPVITLNGPELATVEAGGTWIELGATAEDEIDGELEVTVGGDAVDPNAPVGTEFQVEYSAEDSSGNAVTAIRTVTH